MAWTFSVLAVANVTADSEELAAALSERARRDACRFTLVVPAGDRQARRRTLERALARLRDAGLEIDGVVGDPDPVTAVAETYDPQRHDEIVVCTLPTGVSKWLQVDLPHRVAKITDAPVTHVVAGERKPVHLPGH